MLQTPFSLVNRKNSNLATKAFTLRNMSKTSLEKLLRVPESLRESLARTRADYRRLGNCGLRVSNPILGGLHMGSSRWFPWVLNEEKVSSIPTINAIR